MEDNQNELKHYGVLGMKWGMRRAAKKGTKYQYKSLSTRILADRQKTAKLHGNKSLAKSYEKLLKRSKIGDKKYQEYAKHTSVGKGIAQNLIFGLHGTRAYQRSRALGASRLKSAAVALPGRLFGLTGRLISNDFVVDRENLR